MRDSYEYDEIDLKIDLQRALDKISERNLRIFRERYVKGRSASDIASEYNLATSTIQKILRNVKKELVNALLDHISD